MTIVDIAKKANVSTATVSRVLNGSPNVSDSLRKKVNQIIEESGYTPNIFAKGMVKGTSQTIGIICPVVHDPVQARYLSYIESNLRAYGFNTELLCNMGRSADKSAYLDILLSHRVDAILMIGITMDEIANPEMFLKVAVHIPILVYNGHFEGENIYCVYADEYSAVKDTLRILYNQNYRKTLYIYDTWTFSGYQKFKGFTDGLDECGLSENRNLIYRIPGYSPDNRFTIEYEDFISYAKYTMSDIISKNVEFDSIMTADDVIAVGAIEILRNNGFNISNIPIIGFNNSVAAECTFPRLTSISNMPRYSSKLAVDLLVSVLENKKAEKIHITPYGLVERDSFRLK